MVQLISQLQDFALQVLDLGLEVEHLAVHVVLGAGGDAHLVLDVAELVALAFQLLLGGTEFLRLLVHLRLHVVQVAIQLSHRLFQVGDYLVLS